MPNTHRSATSFAAASTDDTAGPTLDVAVAAADVADVGLVGVVSPPLDIMTVELTRAEVFATDAVVPANKMARNLRPALDIAPRRRRCISRF